MGKSLSRLLVGVLPASLRDAHAKDTEIDDTGVQGKRYPTDVYGRFLARFPSIITTLTLILPFIFFVIGCVRVQTHVEYHLEAFDLQSSIGVKSAADSYRRAMDAWSNTLSLLGTETDRNVDWTQERSRPRDVIEMRTWADPSRLQNACLEHELPLDDCMKRTNLLHHNNLDFATTVESIIRTLPSFKEVCFTNDLEYGRINLAAGAPDCVPPTSISQYVWPTLNRTAEIAARQWHMDGLGTVAQKDFLPRLFVNPSYAWFFDNNFSVLHQEARQLRTGFVLASSPGQSDADYRRRVSAFVSEALRYVRESVAHPYITVMVGGAVVEDIKVEAAASGEGYKVGVAVVICVVLSWWHCGSVTMGLYAGAQVVLTYFAAVGLYAVVYGSLPLMTYSAIVWVMTFGLHGTLSFYDMFVYSGVMATKGRQNHLSVAQRLCFTLRRITLGVWLANVLAIVIFAVNTTSAFDSVRQFSVLMMMAFLWNMYCIALPTPAFVCVHHYHFSNKRRNLQKQTDVLNAAAAECRRGDAMVAVLAAVQGNVSVGEDFYSRDQDIVAARIGVNRGINKKRYKGVGDFFSQQLQQGMARGRMLNHEVTGALHKSRKVRRRYLCFGETGLERESRRNAQEQAGTEGYIVDPDSPRPVMNGCNWRRLDPENITHVPPSAVERTEECWSVMCAAIGQTDDAVLRPPHVYSLATMGSTERELLGFTQRWTRTATELGITTPATSSPTDGTLPMITRTVVRAQDPSYVVGSASIVHRRGRGPDTNSPVTPVLTPATGPVEPTRSGFSIQTMRLRWRRRQSEPRQSCFGLCGRVEGESAEQRMARLMRRSVKREGYTLFERFVLRAYVPFVHRFRWVLLLLLVALVVAVCVAGSYVRAAGIPTTLVSDDDGTSALFASMDDTFGQRGTCVFCGPYYRPLDEYRTATLQDVEQCAASTGGAQMNVYPDLCGVCGGSNTCLDCAGVPNGGRLLQCGGCELANQSTCTCEKSHECPYCEWALGVPNAGGNKCTKECTPSTCGSNGHCNAFTGRCVCDSSFAGAKCDECAAWLVPIWASYDCTAECNAGLNSEECHCELNSKTCTGCPVGLRGYKCDQPAVDCGAHGTYNASTDVCVCAEGWGGELCDVSVQCHLRGPLLSASESPTGEAMCACRGHWRGATCQLCDCMNGGMCDDETGACKCSGAFVGQRCQTCDATCAAHGNCQPVFPSVMNVRTCIHEWCPPEAVAAETTCEKCPAPTLPSGTCEVLKDEASCNQKGLCWWVASGGGGGTCLSSDVVPEVQLEASTRCLCVNNETFSGERCEVCLAPNGTKCMNDGTVVDCTGRTHRSPSTAIGTDACGVCGGDGMCRGCDGVPNSGLVYDSCGICGGNNACIGGDYTPPIYVDLVVDVGNDENPKLTVFIFALESLCRAIRKNIGLFSTSRRCLIEDYLDTRGIAGVWDVADLYNYARANGRMNEGIFTFASDGTPLRWKYMMYRARLQGVNAASPPEQIYAAHEEVDRYLQNEAGEAVRLGRASYVVTSADFPPAAAAVFSKQSLWFAVGIGLAVSFVFLFVFFVSFTAAVGGAVVAAIVCFGTLTVCTFFPSWELDAVLQVCVSCTIPIGVEYVVHMTSGYFDYLQTTTSHLFAKDVSRKAVLKGMLIRTAPSMCTSVVAVVLSAIAFNVSNLVPSRRSGQVCITMHLVLLVAVFLFSGAAAAIGPLRTYQHWTLSVMLCVLCGVLACLAVAFIAAAGGVVAPGGNKVLGR